MDLKEIPLSHISPNPHNPRGIDVVVQDKDLSHLVDSIAKFGVMVPLVVARDDGRYVLLDGERRFHASRQAGLRSVPAFVLTDVAGKDLAKGDLLFRMFQIHHLRLQWGPIQQCHALEETYRGIEKEVTTVDERKRFASEVARLAEVTGIDRRTAADRVKFLRWPSDVKKPLYDDPEDDSNRGAYSYILEIEDKIIIPAMGNYPEYFRQVSADDVRRDLLTKLNVSITHAKEVRQVAQFFRASLSRAADRKRVTRVLTSLRKEPEMTYDEAHHELARQLPDLLKVDPPSPRRLVSMCKQLTQAIEAFDVLVVERAKKRASASPAELLKALDSLQEAASELIDSLESKK